MKQVVDDINLTYSSVTLDVSLETSDLSPYLIKIIKKMADHSKTQEWWDVYKPCQAPLNTRNEGEWWADMDELFHLD